jgi:hypothetical protein
MEGQPNDDGKWLGEQNQLGRIRNLVAPHTICWAFGLPTRYTPSWWCGWWHLVESHGERTILGQVPAYEVQFIGSTSSIMHKTVWQVWAPPKTKFLFLGF